MLEEIKTLAEMTHLPLESAMQIKWRIEVRKDGEILVSREHYKLYTADQYHEFLAEVEGADAYIAVLGWTEPVPLTPVEEIEE
jgi:hypothetical protein